MSIQRARWMLDQSSTPAAPDKLTFVTILCCRYI